MSSDYSISLTSNNLLYYTHCKQLDILPIRYRFDYYELKLFYLIVLKCHRIHSWLRFTHLDRLCRVSDKIPVYRIYNSNSTSGLTNSYFYRTHTLWNRPPYSLRAINRPSKLKTKLMEYI